MVKTFFYRILCGLFLGLSIFAPGFSGSMVAITLGIYHDCVEIIANPLRNIRRTVAFFLPLLIGILFSAIAFVLVFQLLFESFVRTTFMLFIGLIIGNFPIIADEIRPHPRKPRYVIGGFIAFLIALGICMIAIGQDSATAEQSVVINYPLLILSGFAVGTITLLPGMSISTILISVGVYFQLVDFANYVLRLELQYILPLGVFFLAAVVGIVLTARGIKKLFQKVPGLANYCIFGFMVGSLLGIFLQSLYATDPNFTWLIGIAALLAGFASSILFTVISRKKSAKNFTKSAKSREVSA